MIQLTEQILQATIHGIKQLYGLQLPASTLQINRTKPEFEGDYTVVLFSVIKPVGKSPDIIGKELGDFLLSDYEQLFSKYQLVKGFLNLTVSDQYWTTILNQYYEDPCFGKGADKQDKIMIEYSSPNTNKPLH